MGLPSPLQDPSRAIIGSEGYGATFRNSKIYVIVIAGATLQPEQAHICTEGIVLRSIVGFDQFLCHYF
jgi:hypothetical protein